MNDGAQMLINTEKYTVLQIVLFSLGGLFWVLAYAAVLRGIRRHGVIEIPAAAVVSNMAWETTWGLLYKTDLGQLYVWGYRSWFVLDVFIFAFLLRQGAKHIENPHLRPYFRPGVIVGYLCWLLLLFCFVREGYDTPTGLTSGFIATLLMSALYVAVELREIQPGQYSLAVAWFKLLGNGFASLFVLLALPDRRFLLVLCAVTFVLDVVYLMLFRQRRAASPPARARPAAAAVS
jgi:hypothetical protein